MSLTLRQCVIETLMNAATALQTSKDNEAGRDARREQSAVMLRDCIGVAVSRGQYSCYIPHTNLSSDDLNFMCELAKLGGYDATVHRYGLYVTWGAIPFDSGSA